MKSGGRRKQREQTRTQASDESLRDRKAEKALEEAKCQKAKSRSVPLPRRALEGLETKTPKTIKETISITNRNRDRMQALHESLVMSTSPMRSPPVPPVE